MLIFKSDKQGNVVGSIERTKAHKEGILHRAFSVLLEYKGTYIFQIRKHNVFDRTIDVSYSSHQEYLKDTIESDIHAIEKSLKREWDLSKKTILSSTKRGEFVYKAKDSTGFTEHEYLSFYIVKIDTMPLSNSHYSYGMIVLDKSYISILHSFNSLAPWVKIALDKHMIE